MHCRMFAASLLLTCLTTFAAAVSAAAQEPHEVVMETVEGVIERIKAERETLREQPDKVYEVIDDLVLPRFNFTYMAKVVLGKAAWKSGSAQQRKAFTAEFTSLLVRTYAKGLLGYSDETVRYLDTIAKPDSPVVLVKTEIRPRDGRPPTPVDYWLRMKDGEWKVINVAFQGVNLVKTYRQDFAAEARTNGLDALIAKLAEKNKRLATTVLE